MGNWLFYFLTGVTIMPDPISITALANALLDRLYNQTAGRMLQQIQALTNSPTSAMQKALKELDAEADRLDNDDKRMERDNAALEKALRENEQALETTRVLIQANDNTIQASGQSVAVPATTAKVFQAITAALVAQGIDPLSPRGLSEYRRLIQQANIIWNIPNALDFATNYVDSDAWVAKMERWGRGYAELTRKTILEGVQSGWGPRYTASQMRKLAQGIPNHAAENLTRTLQLTAYRDAETAMEQINGQYIEGSIRIATLDDRTCLSCISLHGTQLAPGERVDDHYRGRCSKFYQVVGGPKFPGQMQADSEPGDRRFVPYQSGIDWFNSLPESRQKAQNSFLRSPAKYRAFKDGVALSEFAGEHVDDVFGRQTPERSLLDILGGEAERYYTVNQ